MKKPNNGITGIYMITNPKGDVYIGQSKNILERYYKYNSVRCKGQTIIYNSLKKYGPENHKFEVVEECVESELNSREKFYKLEFLKSHTEGSQLFCFVDDGSSGPHMQTLDSNLKRSKSLKEYYEGCPHIMKGEKRDKKFIEKHYKPILQYDLGGNFIKEWKSQLEVENVLNLQINSALKGNYKSSGGFMWRYKEGIVHSSITSIKGKQKRSKEHCNKISINKVDKGLKPIIQLNLEGEVIREWKSQSEASNNLNINISCISKCLKGKQSKYLGYKWEYKN